MMCFRTLRRKIFNASALNAESTTFDVLKRPVNEVQIVVIGAGLAGLSAASHLIKHGFKRTIVLEATDRYGGRINSKHFGDAFCELGAKWVAIDASKDSMYELLRQDAGLQKQIEQHNDLIYVNTQGVAANRKTTEVVNSLFLKLCSGIELKEKYKTCDLNDLNNVQSYFQSEANKLVQTSFSKEDQIQATEIFNSLFKEFSGMLGVCLDYVNIGHITKVPVHKKGPIYIPTGLDNILKQIINSIDANHMKIGKPVGEIKWFGSKLDPNSVGCVDGSAFAADHIICTLPLGVLKNFSAYLFKPLLPKAKLNAIRNLGFGSPVKVYFEYEKNIKSWFVTNIRPLWTEKELKKDLNWTKQVLGIAKMPTSNRVIEILIGGAFYDRIEKLPDVEVVKEVTKLLRRCLKNTKIPYPTSVLRSYWSSSACYLGGRPYFSTDTTVNDVNTLAAPLGDKPNLLFAGDATILNGFGTIDGARLSGIREAERIIEFYLQQR